MRTYTAKRVVSFFVAVWLVLLFAPPASCATFASLLRVGRQAGAPAESTVTEVNRLLSAVRFTFDGGKYPSYLYPDNAPQTERNLVTAVAALVLDGDRAGNANQDWYCYRGPVTLGGNPVPAPRKKGENVMWRAAFLIGGTGKFYQGKALIFPEGTLAAGERDRLFAQFRACLPESRTREEANGVTVTEHIAYAPHPSIQGEFLKHTVAWHSKPAGPNAFEVVLVFLTDFK